MWSKWVIVILMTWLIVGVWYSSKALLYFHKAMERYFTVIVCDLEDPWIYFFKPYKWGILELTSHLTSHQTKTWIGNRIRRFREGGKIRKWETTLIERLSCAGYSCHSTCSTCSRLHKADKHEPISPSICDWAMWGLWELSPAVGVISITIPTGNTCTLYRVWELSWQRTSIGNGIHECSEEGGQLKGVRTVHKRIQRFKRG